MIFVRVRCCCPCYLCSLLSAVCALCSMFLFCGVVLVRCYVALLFVRKRVRVICSCYVFVFCVRDLCSCSSSLISLLFFGRC